MLGLFLPSQISWSAMVTLTLLVCALGLCIAFCLLMQQEFLAWWAKWDARHLEDQGSRILDFISSDDPAVLAHLHRSRALRDHIIRLSTQFQGEALTKFSHAYISLGYAMDDFQALAHGTLTKRMQALQRCRTLKINLPDEAWLKLLKHSDRTFRWASMEYLILLKGKESFLWFLHFMEQPQNQTKGMALHLSTCFAKAAPIVFAALLKQTSSPFLREIFMTTLALYPVPGTEHLIENMLSPVLGYTKNVNFLAAGARALAASPSDSARTFLLSLVTHPDASIRSLVCELLTSFPDQEIIEAFEILTLDASFSVRTSAVEALMSCGLPGERSITTIAADDDHPSHLLIQRSRSLKRTV